MNGSAWTGWGIFGQAVLAFFLLGCLVNIKCHAAAIERAEALSTVRDPEHIRIGEIPVKLHLRFSAQNFIEEFFRYRLESLKTDDMRLSRTQRSDGNPLDAIRLVSNKQSDISAHIVGAGPPEILEGQFEPSMSVKLLRIRHADVSSLNEDFSPFREFQKMLRGCCRFIRSRGRVAGDFDVLSHPDTLPDQRTELQDRYNSQGERISGKLSVDPLLLIVVLCGFGAPVASWGIVLYEDSRRWAGCCLTILGCSAGGFAFFVLFSIVLT
jgi:hypothetical protein